MSRKKNTKKRNIQRRNTKRMKSIGGSPKSRRSSPRSPSQSAKLISDAVLMDDYFEDTGPYTYSGKNNIESKKKWVEKIDEEEQDLRRRKELKEKELRELYLDINKFQDVKKRYEALGNTIKLSSDPRATYNDVSPPIEAVQEYIGLFQERSALENDYEKYMKKYHLKGRAVEKHIERLKKNIREDSDKLQEIELSFGPGAFQAIKAELNFDRHRRSSSGGKGREKTHKKKYACYVEPVHKLDRRTGAYTRNFKIIDGTRVYYTKHFDKNPNSKRILENYQRENPKKCMAFARMEDHILNQQDRAIKHLNKTGSCKIGDKLSYKVTILSGKMREKLGDNYTHHETLIDDVMRCR